MARDVRTRDTRGNSASVAPRIENREIRDLTTFDAHTSDDQVVAGLLFYKELDCLVDLARAVSLDFFQRPQMYKNVTKEVARLLAALSVRYGAQEDFMSREQRHLIYAPVFGREDRSLALSDQQPYGGDNFAPLRDRLLTATAAFAERVYDTGEDMLRAAVRVMQIDLKNYLDDVSGASVHWAREEGLPAITEELSYPLLRSASIAAVFGVSEPPRAEWPYIEDANGAKLVEEISAQLFGRDRQISRAALIQKQDEALRGAEALATVIDFAGGGSNEDLDLLITKCYTWYAARLRVASQARPGPAQPLGSAYAPSAATAPALAPENGNRGVGTLLAAELSGVGS